MSGLRLRDYNGHAPVDEENVPASIGDIAASAAELAIAIGKLRAERDHAVAELARLREELARTSREPHEAGGM